MAAVVPKTYNVLIVDDSDDDRFFLRRVLQRFPRFALIGELSDGEEAISYLAGGGLFSDRREYPLPHLILLDLKMPRKTGFDVLQWLHTQWFPNLTVVVLSSSNLAEDVGASLALGAQGFWTKTAHMERQDNIAQEIEALLDKRWRQWSEAPPPRSGNPRSDSMESHSHEQIVSSKHSI
jgi:DNA-binding NarL/FixJ family response regulator